MQISQSQIPGILSSIISVPITSKWLCQESERNWDLFCPSSVSLLVTALSGHREVPISPIYLKINNAEVWNQENSYSCKLKVVCSNFPGVIINLSMVIMMFFGRWSITVDKKAHQFINMYFVNRILLVYKFTQSVRRFSLVSLFIQSISNLHKSVYSSISDQLL